MNRNGLRRDAVIEHTALGASFLCLVHCLAFPVLIAALPVLSTIIPVGPHFHIWMLAIALPASSVALTSGQMRHGASWPLLTGLFGLFFLACGVLAFEGTTMETVSTAAGAILLAIAHIANLRLRSTCGISRRD